MQAVYSTSNLDTTNMHDQRASTVWAQLTASPVCSAPHRRKDANPYEELNRMVQEALSRAWRQELRGDLSAACRDLLDRCAGLLHGRSSDARGQHA
jgi:hypothetical protein